MGRRLFPAGTRSSPAISGHSRPGIAGRNKENAKEKKEEKMARSSYAELLKAAKVMAAGLRDNASRVAKRGLTASFIDKLEKTFGNVMNLDNEQEDLKAKLKMKTAELAKQSKALRDQLSEARKVVKLEMEKETWKSFGLQAKR
jgi:predicted AAA+ superfamily ATPase